MMAGSFEKLRYKKLSTEKVITTSMEKAIIKSILKSWFDTEKALIWETDSGILGYRNRFTGTVTVRYRFRRAEVRRQIACDIRHIVLKVTAAENGSCEIRYFLVFNRIRFLLKKLLAIVLFLPLLIVFFNLPPDKMGLILESVGAGIMTLGGILILFDKEDPQKTAPLMELFEKKIHTLFPV